MIDQTGALSEVSLEDIKRSIDTLYQSSTGIVYSSDTASAVSLAEFGKIVIADDGTTKRLYFKTGLGNVGYVTLT